MTLRNRPRREVSHTLRSLARTRSLRIAASVTTFALVAAASNVARADEVLIFQTMNNDPAGGDTAAAEASLVFEALGHDVTVEASLSPTMPDDLSGFDSVWIIQRPAITSPIQQKLIAYAKSGGGLYLTGENPCCESKNQSVNNIATAVLRQPFPLIGQTVEEGGDLFEATPADPFGLTSTPNEITEWKTQAAGLMSNVPPDRAVFSKPGTGSIGAAAYPSEDFAHGSGCIYIAMDLTYWLATAPEQDLEPLVENIQQFLSTCADSDGDGVSDEGEAEFGTDPADPDTDDDGLCDGYAAVEGVCIDGESPLDNFDGDDLIAPLDDDDDNDGVPTAFEVNAESLAPNVDGDMIPAWNDLDSDNNFILDDAEGTGDYDGDGIPAIVDDGDEPTECLTDSDCGDTESGMICNEAVGSFCQPGCRGSGGNGCPDGETCTSTDQTVGQCVGGGEGGGGPGGGSSEGGGSAAGGDSANGGNADGGSSSGNGTFEDGDSPDDGCNCTMSGAPTSRWAGVVAFAALTVLRRRRRRS